MTAADLTISLSDFLREATARPSRFMWFLGAGASRRAMMPTADDLIWELKLRQYCRKENQDIQQHDSSILTKTFRCEPVPPDLADEQASELLARIGTSKRTAPTKRARKKPGA